MIRINILLAYKKVLLAILTVFIVGCGIPSLLTKEPTPELPPAGIPPEPVGEKIDFFQTAQRARDDIASLIHLSETRLDATFSSLIDSVIVKDEEKHLSNQEQDEYDTYQDLVFTLDSFLQLIPAGGIMDNNIRKGRINLVVKYDSYSKSIEAGIKDQYLSALEKTAIESNARSMVSELQFIESYLPLPFDSLKVGPTFIVEADSVDLFFEIINDIEDMTKEINQLREKLKKYQESQIEMESFLEREEELKKHLKENKLNIEKLYASVDTTQQAQKQVFTKLTSKIETESQELDKKIRQVDAATKADISQLSFNIIDSLTFQQRQSDSLFFQLGVNLDLFQEEMDSLKGVIRFYDVAEKGLPLLDEEVLNILKLPLLRHKITLKNGTIVIGQILAENLDVIVLQTSMGKLVIEKDFIAKYDEKVFPGPKIVIDEDYEVSEHREYEEFIGTVRNIGNKRADFVKVTFMLWGPTTEPLGVGSGFVDGKTVKFVTGVISNSSIEPDESAKYQIRVDKRPGVKTAYRTNDVSWREFD